MPCETPTLRGVVPHLPLPPTQLKQPRDDVLLVDASLQAPPPVDIQSGTVNAVKSFHLTT